MRFFTFATVWIITCSNFAIAQGNDPYANVLASPSEIKPADNDDEQTALLKQRFNAAHREMRTRYNYWLQGVGETDGLLHSIDRFHKARLEIGPKTNERICAEQKLAFAKQIEAQCEKSKSKAKYEAIRDIDECSAGPPGDGCYALGGRIVAFAPVPSASAKLAKIWALSFSCDLTWLDAASRWAGAAGLATQARQC